MFLKNLKFHLNHLPNNEISVVTTLKAFADDKCCKNNDLSP